jgi:hypothetical protein
MRASELASVATKAPAKRGLNPNALTGYRRSLEELQAPDVIAELWNSPDVWFMYEQVFLKEGGESRRTPWPRIHRICQSPERRSR